ncbi:MAG TPA: TonB-dependent receptor, partial [Chitinophaga sp.]|uniref:SusC/RagA family TonB-linked outer membrane protein n=1 Tax=Chitinophaga sp. TaxID=1869181 RepID=UPI002DB75149
LRQLSTAGGLLALLLQPFYVKAHAAGPFAAWQQPAAQPITGQVLDAQDHTPLLGVTIAVKGTSHGTTTGDNGRFTLQAPAGSTLVITYVGYDTQEQPVTAGVSSYTINLAKSSKNLNEIVVVSYGTQKQRNITGAISTLNAAEMADMPVGQFAQKLQGKVPGVQINQSTGRPGQGMSFRIRGSASLNAGNGPLFVVDGQPIVGGINNINPDEIESFSVLKDASATSLYGSRAANGVVLVTTKHAKPGETKVQLNAYYGVQQVPQHGRPDVMNAREFAQFKKAYYEDKIKYENWTDPATGLAEVPEEFQHPEQYGEGTNWFNTLIRNAPVQNYTISVSSGTEKFSSSIVGTYFNQEGVLYNTGYKRYSFRANNEFRPNDRLKLGFNIAPTQMLEHNTRVNTDGYWQIIQAAVMTTPLKPAINPDGTLPLTATSTGMFPNPNWYRVLQEKLDNFRTNRLLGNAYAELELLRGLRFRTHVDVDVSGETHNNFVPSTAVGAVFVAPPQKATGTYGTVNYNSWLNENTLTYNTTVGAHNIEALAGYTAQKYKEESSFINGTDFPDDDIPWLSNAATKTAASSNTVSWSLLSMIGRLNYSYKDKYLLSGAVRRDGSSRFGKDRKWGWFPSVSAGWVLSEENFVKALPVVSFLKVRASYGLTGNNNIGNYTAISGMDVTNYVFGGTLSPGKSITTLGNPELGWETTRQVDVGLDIGLLKDRVYLTYDYYHKVTDGMLYPVELPRASGFSSIQFNVGKFKFWGHEIGISSRNLTGALKWNTDFNITINRNRVMQLGTNNTPIGGNAEQADYWRTVVGRPMGQFFGYVFDGVYMNQQEFNSQPKHASSDVGTVRMKDVNGDKVVDINDRTFIGDPTPKFLFGLSNDFRYRNFDLNIVISGAVGGKILDASYEMTQNLDAVFNVRRAMADHWRSEDDPGNGLVPRTKDGTTALYRFTNDSWVFDGTYATIKNITLGYTLPFRNLRYLKDIRVYGSVQQALVLTKYRGMNPEVSANGLDGLRQGVDNTAYPVPRTWSLGVNVNF